MKILEMSGKSTARVIEADAPAPKPGEVLISTAASAICGSEMHVYHGAGIQGNNGGHEAVGTVVDLGRDVTNLALGQRVGVSVVAGCGDCAECERGRYTWCKAHTIYGQMHAEQVYHRRQCLPHPAG